MNVLMTTSGEWESGNDRRYTDVYMVGCQLERKVDHSLNRIVIRNSNIFT